jgi:hypothetical protein
LLSVDVLRLRSGEALPRLPNGWRMRGDRVVVLRLSWDAPTTKPDVHGRSAAIPNAAPSMMSPTAR